MFYDAIIIGSGAGGSAAAYGLAKAGARVLLLEKGDALPRDGSTLDSDTVMRRGAFLSQENWIDNQGQRVIPEEHFNLGGKTKWYGAALLRMGAEEFGPDYAHQCVGWPIEYQDIAPYYDQAEALLSVRSFPAEHDLLTMVAGLRRLDSRWRQSAMPLGLSADILSHPDEARRYDAFASVKGVKSDAQRNLLEPLRGRANLTIMTGKEVERLLPHPQTPLRIAGVECAGGLRFEAGSVLLAAGALHSPRLLQTYMETHRLGNMLPAYRNVGRNYKSHVLTAMLVFSTRAVRDVLCKTLLVLSDGFPHSSVQTLGGNLAEEIIRLQAPRLIPRALVHPMARRAYGLFLQTEDGSHRDNRIAANGKGERPLIDYDVTRLAPALSEHRDLVRTLKRQLLRLRYLPVVKAIPITGTAHACGTLMTGTNPHTSVTNPDGRVHGMENLYVADGSVLPRSSRVNPALTIYAWGLRLAAHLSKGEMHAYRAAGVDTVRT